MLRSCLGSVTATHIFRRIQIHPQDRSLRNTVHPESCRRHGKASPCTVMAFVNGFETVHLDDVQYQVSDALLILLIVGVHNAGIKEKVPVMVVTRTDTYNKKGLLCRIGRGRKSYRPESTKKCLRDTCTFCGYHCFV